MGKVTALFKSGNRSDPDNYRPIAILPTLSKILERTAHQQLYSYLNENLKLTSKQFGFRPKLSTCRGCIGAQFTDTILKYMHGLRPRYWRGIPRFIEGFRYGEPQPSYSLIVLYRLSTNTRNWFRSYLTNRCQVTPSQPLRTFILPANLSR